MSFLIKIKQKSFFNKHNNDNIIALKNIDIKINHREFVCIVGPSGCGKTTLMNIIGGLIKSEDQEISIDNKQLNIDKNFGYVFQTSRLLPWLTVRENIELVCDLNDSNSKKRINDLLKDFDLNDFEDFYPKSISGGMRRKVSLARALVRNPKILLMDEPFVSLDLPTAENLYKILKKYWEKNYITVILITHNLKEAILLGKRILFFSKRPGTIVYDYKIKFQSDSFKIDHNDIQSEYNKLNKKFPSLLKGLL
ncbi:MAG: ABC transporter ATP-binding protein [Pseudomonadota bacterium]|nr:ABC transporter ATP-binding protein [Pseudomonadota bacterium]